MIHESLGLNHYSSVDIQWVKLLPKPLLVGGYMETLRSVLIRYLGQLYYPVRNVWYYCKAQSFYTDPGENLLDTWYVYMLRNKTVHQATQRGAWLLLSMAQKHLFSEHWHVTYTVTFPFTQGRGCFPNIWIKSGSTTWLCDELLTIVVLALVNRFVHGRVPTAVRRKWNICVVPAAYLPDFF